MTGLLLSANLSETAPVIDYEALFAEDIRLISDRLDVYLDRRSHDASPEADGLWEAMRYSVLDGGKRIRSVLAIEACKSCGGSADIILPTVCAIEMIHSQSLIHDDLPCMDNDDMRRGKPSVHKAFGESTAVLAGDALIAMAFGVIARETPMRASVTPALLLTVLGDFSEATSIRGLVNGQYVDIRYEGRPYTAEILDYIHAYKTGALFRFALRAGARLSGAPDNVVERFTRLGGKLGLAFQIVDDLLDIGSTSEVLGKTVGKDRLQEKATYPALYGEKASREAVWRLSAEAVSLAEERGGMPEGYDPSILKTLISFISDRIR